MKKNYSRGAGVGIYGQTDYHGLCSGLGYIRKKKDEKGF